MIFQSARAFWEKKRKILAVGLLSIVVLNNKWFILILVRNILIIAFLFFSQKALADWKINYPYQVFIQSDELINNIKFCQSSKYPFLCDQDDDDFKNDVVSIKNKDFKESLKLSFNKTFTDWDTMDEFSSKMVEFCWQPARQCCLGLALKKKNY